MSSKLAFALVLSVATIASCRSSTVCDSHSCERVDLAAGGDAGARGDGGAGSPADPARGLGGAGEGGSDAHDEGAAGAGARAAGAGGEEAGGAGAATGLSFEPCDAPAADCDGSTQTKCESNIDWNARNCGACAEHCAGACAKGQCGEEQIVLHEAAARAFLAADPVHYVLTELEQLVSVERANLAVTLLADGLAGATHLARAGDHVYAWGDGSDDPVYSVGASGGAVREEQFPGQTSFGASQDGVYCTSSDDLVTGASLGADRLWFRPAGQTRFTAVAVNEPDEILASCAAAIVVEIGAAPESQLVRVSKGKVTPLGPAPGSHEQAICDEDVVAVLTGPDEAREIYVYDEKGMTRIALGAASLDVAQHSWLLGGILGVSLTWRSHGNVNLGSLAGVQVGLPPNAVAVHADRDFVWYNVLSSEVLSPQLMRAPYSLF